MINLRIPVLNITSIVLFFLLMASSLTTLAQEMQVVNMRGTIIEPNNISHNVRYEVAFPKNLVGQLTEATNWGGSSSSFDMTIIDEAANARWPIDSAKVYHPPYLSDGGGCGGDYFAFWWKLDSNSKSYACNLARKPASCDKGQGPTGAFRGRCSDPDDRKNRYFDMVMTPNPIQNITPAKPRDTKAHKYDGIAWYQLTSNAKDVLGISGDISLKGVQFKNGALYSNGVYQENKARAFPKNWDLTRFSISAKFYVNDMNKSRPVFITAHRWLGYYLDKNGTISMKYNNSNMVTSNTRYKINTWHTASITYENGIAYFSLDGVQIGQKKIKFDFVNKNPTPSICITDFSNGATFKGWIKDLIVYRWN